MKPIGIFSAHDGIPKATTFAQLADFVADETFVWARQFSEGRAAIHRPFVWVLALIGPSADTPAAQWVPAVRARLHATGLLPHVAAVCYREEWYNDMTSERHILDTHRWVSLQHKAIKESFPDKPLVSIEAFFFDSLAFGAAYFRPEFAHVDIRAVEAYVPKDMTWESLLMEPKMAYACGERVGAFQAAAKPVVLVAQAFRAGGHDFPTPEHVAHTARWVQHPRVIAVWPFDWASRGAAITGWRDWHGNEALRAWGVAA